MNNSRTVPGPYKSTSLDSQCRLIAANNVHADPKEEAWHRTGLLALCFKFLVATHPLSFWTLSTGYLLKSKSFPKFCCTSKSHWMNHHQNIWLISLRGTAPPTPNINMFCALSQIINTFLKNNRYIIIVNCRRNSKMWPAPTKPGTRVICEIFNF